MATIKWEAGSPQTLLSTGLNSLATTQSELGGTPYDNATNLYLYGVFELLVTFGTGPTANNPIDLYLVPSVDGTNYVDGTDGASPISQQQYFAGSFYVRNVTSAQRLYLGGPGAPYLIPLPPLLFKPQIVNRAGQTFAASGNTLIMVPYRYSSA